MASSVVSLKKCRDYCPERIRQALESHFSLLGGLDRFISRGDVVLLKPNFIVPRPSQAAVQTDGAVILELAKMLKDRGRIEELKSDLSRNELNKLEGRIEMEGTPDEIADSFLGIIDDYVRRNYPRGGS